jgi:type IV secretion system protein VirB9
LESYPATDVQKPVKISPKEREALNLAAEWKNSQDKPVRGEDGIVRYVYGATMPTLICAPRRVCMIQLEPGEMIVSDIVAGDNIRWDIIPLVGERQTIISVKTTYSNIETNMTVLTNLRTYFIALKSAKHEWMPVMGFVYPENAKKAWETYKKKMSEVAYSSTLSTGENVSALDFEYRMTGESPWKPIRVYNDGKQTYIQFSSANFNNGAPALVAIGEKGGMFSDDSTEIYNYRVIGDRYVVDGLPKRMSLMSGAGKGETGVMIDHVGGKRQ